MKPYFVKKFLCELYTVVLLFHAICIRNLILNASERVLVKVINVLGQEVNMDDEPFKGTVLFNVYDDGSVQKFVQ